MYAALKLRGLSEKKILILNVMLSIKKCCKKNINDPCKKSIT